MNAGLVTTIELKISKKVLRILARYPMIAFSICADFIFLLKCSPGCPFPIVMILFWTF